jgi:hydrogenase maturation protein HypF
MDRTAAPALERRRVTIRGVVQGVGFRPFVYRLAREHRLTGWVRNTGAGVEVEVEGEAGKLEAFVRLLRMEAPPLARIEHLESRACEPRGDAVFRILPSRVRTGELQPISSDVATCTACLAETDDPGARRFRYPFTNCTHCGPRFTIIEALPYDRARTTMRAFPLCAACREEYEDPADRRFHAEPIACPTCGPKLEFRVQGHTQDHAVGDAALRSVVSALRAGRIVAVKGLGGFQLTCDAADQSAVARLRDRKHREAKPFALMVADLDTARALCEVSDAEAALLTSPRAPIVLLRRREPAPDGAPRLAGSVAPGLGTLGMMLPPTPLHHLLLRECGGPLVMTSGNRSEEPIAGENGEATERLGGTADAFLLHDREISSRYDDSVVRIVGPDEVVLRRARGYAPEPVRLPRAAPAPILAVGPQLKNTFCLVREDQAFVSQHIGDLDDALTLAHYHRTLALYRGLFGVEPEVVAYDLHPGYAATRFARSLDGVRQIGVQHHHAHVVSCMAEHGITEPVIGVAFDGAGYGTDGAVWGGELLVADWQKFRRAAHLAYLRLPGGDMAARQPWRMGLSALFHAFGDQAGEVAAELLAAIPEGKRTTVLGMVRRGVHALPTSSAGRLFDAVAALVGVRYANQYEGQAAMELEARVDQSEQAAYSLPLTGGVHIWDPGPLIRAIVDDVRRGTAAGIIAARFHNALSSAVVEGCRGLRENEGLATVVLSGGCFQNRRLLSRTRAGLEREGFRVLTHRCVPPNDGGISLGQAAIALATLTQQEQ